MGMKAPFRVLQSLCGLSVLGAFFFSWLWAFSFWNRITIYRNREHYQSQSFIVVDAVYSRDGEMGDSYWLEGTVNEQPERLIPHRLSAAAVKTTDDLLRRYPKGTNIPVLYNSNATKTLVQSESLRVMEATHDFWEKEARLRLRFALYIFLPVPLTLSLYLWMRYTNRRRQDAGPAVQP